MSTNKMLSLFPTSILTSIDEKDDVNREKILKIIYEIYNKDKKGKEKAKVVNKHSGYTTFSSELNIMNDERFNKVKQFVCKSIKYYSEYMDINTQIQEIYMSDMWINIQFPGNSFRAHRHYNGFLTSVFYFQAEKNSGEISFIDPKDSHLMIMPAYTKETQFNAHAVNIQPRAGMNLTFPGWALHEIGYNESNKDRVIIGFNFKIGKKS